MTSAQKFGYLPSLDGWRAFAILGVLAAHDRSWSIAGHSLDHVMGMGGYGVNLFFAISGFLITTRILEEESLVGSFHIGRFYVRRFFRIQPAQFAFLFVAAILIATGTTRLMDLHDTWRTWTASLLLYVNFQYRSFDPNILTGHFWTLAVEEHFYLLLSLVLFFVRRNRAVVVFGLFLVFAIWMEGFGAVRGTAWYLPAGMPRATQWHLTPLLLASSIAVFARFDGVARNIRTYLKPWTVSVGTIVLSLVHHTYVLWTLHRPIQVFRHLDGEAPMVSTYLFIWWIVSTVFHPKSLATRVLEWKPLRFIGTISYSLYLWHVLVFIAWYVWLQPLISRCTGLPNRLVFTEPIKFLLAILVASASYYWLEKPLIRLGHRLAPSATVGRPELAGIGLEKPDAEAAEPVRHTR